MIRKERRGGSRPAAARPDVFIGYARVSTEGQGVDGHSLEVQRKMLEDYAHEMGVRLEILPSMEPGHGGFGARRVYKEVLRQAAELRANGERVGILVVNPSRLTRSLKDLKLINLKSTPIWIVGEGRVSKERIVEGVTAAERELTSIRVAGGASRGRRRNPVGAAKEDQLRGSRNGSDRRDDRTDGNLFRVIDQMRKNALPTEVSLKDLMQQLNDAHIWNRQSNFPFREVPWTEDSLRRKWREGRQQIALDDEPDAEEWSPFVDGDPAPKTDEAALPMATEGSELPLELIPERSRDRAWLARAASWAKGLVQKFLRGGRL